MAFYRWFACALSATSVVMPAFAQTIQVSNTPPPPPTDELVRLPGQGEVKRNLTLNTGGADRLIPGGGLLLSFDEDRNGRITTAEIEAGIIKAFASADENEDGRMTPLEQMAWAERLPTRDTSLANPARFDPNLDRSVREAEFSEVVIAFAARLRDAETGEVHVEALESKIQRRKANEEPVAPPRRETNENDAAEQSGTSGQGRSRTTGRGS